MKAYAVTDVGKVRRQNEDAIFTSTDPVGLLPNLFVVADGMGGHNAGDRASKIAVDSIISSVEETNKLDPEDILRDALVRANKAIISEAAQEPSLAGMGTTAVMATVIGSVLYVANIGDSRLYVIKNRPVQVTRDHSWVEEMVREGKLNRGDPTYMEKKNIITKALGIAGEIAPDLFTVDRDVGNLILLCSDGLTGMVNDDTLFEIVRHEYEPQEIAAALVRTAKNNGGRDNISVVVVDPELSEVDVWC